MIINTKSGTNAMHGTAYEFFRDDGLDTINYFAKKAGQPKATNNQNQFGGNAGGPSMKNRAFFFFDYEGTRIEQGVLRTGRVFTAAERNGVLTGNVRDPLTGTNFPGSTIPLNRIDPVATQIMSLMPLPNTTGSNNFINQPNVEDESDRILGRVDWHPSDTDSVFGRYIWSDRFRYVPGWFGGVLDGTSTSAWGRNSKSNGPSAAGPRSSAPAWSTKRASRGRAGPTTAPRIRSASTATRRSASRACRTTRRWSAASSASTSPA